MVLILMFIGSVQIIICFKMIICLISYVLGAKPYGLGREDLQIGWGSLTYWKAQFRA